MCSGIWLQYLCRTAPELFACFLAFNVVTLVLGDDVSAKDI